MRLALFTLVLYLAVPSQGAVVNALSPNRTDVVNAHAACVDGDTLAIPAGTSTPYTDQVEITKAITILGAGRTLTTLINGITTTTWHGRKPIFQISVNSTKAWKIEGIRFEGQYGNPSANGKAIFVSSGMGRVTRNYFYRCNDRAIQYWSGSPLIVDHNIEEDSWSFGSSSADSYGAFTRPVGLGTTNTAVYVEDNYIIRSGPTWAPVVWDGGYGSRTTFRFNIVSNIGVPSIDYALDSHGNQGSPFGDPGTSIAGTMYLEAYNNVFSMGTANRGVAWRGGHLILFNNKWFATGGNILLSGGRPVLATEEDGYRFGSPILQAWPGHHGHTNSYIFADTFNGNAVTDIVLEFPGTTPCTNPAGCGSPWPSDSIFIQKDRDYYIQKPSTNFYKPLIYPHPRVTLEDDAILPGAFVTIFPVNGQTAVSTQPTIVWAAMAGETGVRVMLANNLFYTNPIVDVNLAANTTQYAIPGGLLTQPTEYFLRVWATNASGVRVSNGDTIAFTTGPDPVPGSIVLATNVYSINEDAGPLTVTAKRVGGVDGLVTCAYGTSPVTATPGVNYTTTSGTLTWPDGDGTDKTFNVTILDDGVFQSDVTFNAGIGTPTGGATLGSPTNSVVTVVNTDSPPADPPLMADLSFCGYEALITSPAVTNASGWLYVPTETTNGLARWRFTITTATNYIIMANMVGQNTSANSWHVDVDTDPDPSSNYKVFSYAVTGATPETRPVSWVGTGTSQSQFPTNVWFLNAGVHTLYFRSREANAFLECLTIQELPAAPDPVPQYVSWFAPGSSILESGSIANITINRLGGTTNTVSVNYTTLNGNAFAGQDYTATSGVAIMTNGVANYTIPVPILQNVEYQGSRDFYLVLSNPTNCTIYNNQSNTVVTILDDEHPASTPSVVKIRRGKFRNVFFPVQ